jgi:sterol desaturase/sphingolipid hydroxylase (fatty acid hydroxylase superfamily)
VLAFLLLDFADYAFHRLSHRSRVLWLLHSVHHSDTAVDVSTNLRHHPVHVLATILWKIVAVAAVGAPILLAMVRETLVMVVAQFHHAAIAWPGWIEQTIGWVFVSPRAHWVHHSPIDGETDANFGTGLVLWDRLFGTYVDPTRPRVERFGLNALRDQRWQSALGMLLTPIRARKFERL